MSEYSKLKEKGMKRGRPRHTDEQKALSQLRNSLRQEARRRAHLVLKNRHQEEFNEIYEQEMTSLIESSSSPQAKSAKKSSRKS